MFPFLQRLFHLRWLRWTALILVGLAGTFALIDWLAERRWQAYVAEARARGVKLTVAEVFDRPPIPDGDNFAMLPVWSAMRKSGKNLPLYPEASSAKGSPKSKPGPPVLDLSRVRRGMVKDKWLSAEQDVGLDAEVVLLGLRKVEAELQQILEGASRPRSRFPVDMRAGFAADFSHLIDVLRMARYTALKIQTELVLAHGNIALSYWRMGWTLARSADEEQTLISGLTHFACGRLLVDAVYHGLKLHAWTDPQLLEIERCLAAENDLQVMQNAIVGERVVFNHEMEKLLPARDISFLTSGLSKEEGMLLWLCSRQRRWWRNNQLWMNQYFDELAEALDVAGERWVPSVRPDNDPAGLRFHHDLRDLDFYLAGECARTYEPIIGKAVFQHAYLRLAGLACALERYRHAHAVYPEKLADLVPEFLSKLPHEPTNGEPFRYRLDSRDGYLLYSIGIDGKDEEGKVGENQPIDADWPDWRWWAPGSAENMPSVIK